MPFSVFRKLSDGSWLDVVVRSIEEPETEGVRFAGFPSPELQKQIIGSSGATALKEAWRFYVKVKAAARANDIEPAKATILDFGAGWGRMLRFFAREAGSDRLFGVDTNIRLVDLCRTTGVPGAVCRIALVPLSYIERVWSTHFSVVEYLDDAKAFQQAVLTARRL